MEYYYTDGTRQPLGPVPLDQLRALAAQGTITSTWLVAAVGSQQWSPIGSVLPDLFGAVPAAAPALAGAAPAFGAPPHEPLAYWSFGLSLAAFVLCCGLFTGLPGIICGHIALSRIRQRPGTRGRGFAIAGLIIGYVSVVLLVIYLAFGGLAAVQTALEAAQKAK